MSSSHSLLLQERYSFLLLDLVVALTTLTHEQPVFMRSIMIWKTIDNVLSPFDAGADSAAS